MNSQMATLTKTPDNTVLTWNAHWIWTPEPVSLRNAFVRFRRDFHYEDGAALLHLTCDARYVLWVNGHYLGQGPVRAWPAHWHYDTYDIAPHLQRGQNTICVLVNHWNEGNFQYIPAPAGLLAQLELKSETIGSDAKWYASPSRAFVANAPRASVQLAFEEQFDARLEDDWKAIEYSISWPHAVELRPAHDGFHGDLKPRDIPFLTQEPVLPQRLVRADSVRSRPYQFTFNIREAVTPDNFTSNSVYQKSFAATQIFAPDDCEITFVLSHKRIGKIKVNGELLPFSKKATDADSYQILERTVKLRAGWNDFLAELPSYHLLEYAVAIDGPPGLRFAARGVLDGASVLDGALEDATPGENNSAMAGKKSAVWAVIGPFTLSETEMNAAENHANGTPIVAVPLHESATAERALQVWEKGEVAALLNEPFFQLLGAQQVPDHDVFVQAYTESSTRNADADSANNENRSNEISGIEIRNEEALMSGADWTTIFPSASGDVRLLLDFGREVVGFHRFEVDAAAGTILDWHNFEFIQPDGRCNFTEELNDSFRYICREGAQSYQTYHRRGFQYSFLILRDMKAPVKLRGVQAIFNTYPQQRRGAFACSDANLDRIWEVGAHTLRLCAEDTFTDCPTYEQTHWVGDMRNEGLIDWAINGDARLWFHCLEQAGQSLERSPLIESHVPSSWQNLLPAWSFLWMRSCREYLLFSGDRDGAARLLPWIERNVAGIESYRDARGLFEIRAWNMFDWAAMDTPVDGVVTHNNCFAVHALRDAAELAHWLERDDLATQWRHLADEISAATNAHLWNNEKDAFTDCSRNEVQSAVFSQQTHTVAVMSGVAADHSAARLERCRELMHHPEDDFVKAGSPFFEFFLLEAYQREGRDQEFLDTIRRDWGFMIDQGANTFWELWSYPGARLTRSHCHGWSAAPTYFLSTHVLGAKPHPHEPQKFIVEPHPADLKWCRGRVPTSHGVLDIQWENRDGELFELRVRAPETLEIEFILPREGRITRNGQTVLSAV